MSLYFVTGNGGKFAEIKQILSHIEQIDVDLPKIQSLDPKEIVKAKLLAALAHTEGEFVVEDTSLSFMALGGFPGPLIKWFLKASGKEKIVKILESLGDTRAEAKTLIGYARNPDEIY